MTERLGTRKEGLYQVVTAPTLGSLEQLVEDLMRHGWTPVGGLVVYTLGDPARTPDYVHAQAMEHHHA